MSTKDNPKNVGTHKSFINLFKKLENPKAIEHRLLELGMNLKEFGMKLGYSAKSASQATSRIVAGKIKFPKTKQQKALEVLGWAETGIKEVASAVSEAGKKIIPIKNYLSPGLSLAGLFDLLSNDMKSQFILEICEGNENKKAQIKLILGIE